MLKRLLAVLSLLALSSVAALAADCWPNVSGVQVNCGVVESYLDANSKSVPVSAASPLPVAATITPSGTQDVNITKILGAAPSLTNPFWVFPATGATFPVSAASLPLPAGAATSALQSTINTTLGSPYQAGGALPLPAGAATAALQNVATENHTGEVGSNIFPITNGMTTSNATVTTGQSIGGIQTLANAVRVSGSLGASGTGGIIQSVVLTFLDAVGSGPLDVYFYNATVTTGSNCANATTFVLQTADRTNVLGIAHVTDFTSSNTAVVAQANNLAIPFGLGSATSLFACVVARASFAITGTANASIKVNVLRQ